MMAYNSHTLVVQCMNDEWVKFRSHRGLGLASTVSKQAGAAMDVYFAIFCVNCFVNSKSIKPQNQRVSRRIVYILCIKCLYFFRNAY